MALNPSGPISLGGTTAGQSIALENGGPGTAQIALNDAAVRSLAGVLSGAIVMPTDFWGKANAQSLSITTNQTNLNLRTWALANGWNGSSQVTITINGGVYVYSTSTGTPGLTIDGSWPGGVKLINNGFVMGMGGAGGHATVARAGNAGGAAINLGVSCEIDSAVGYIGGGGGGGGGGDGGPTGIRTGGGGGGAGGGAGGAATFLVQGSSPLTAPGGAGGGVGASGSTGPTNSALGIQGRPAGGGGGGGGGRILPGTGGASQSGGQSSYIGGLGGGSGGGGGLGGSSTSGAGGSSNSGGGAGSASPGLTQACGGGGGGWGALGGNGGGSNQGTGAPGGKAVNLNGFTVTWTGGLPATVYGAIS